MITTTQEKTFKVFCCLSRMMRQHMYQTKSHIEIVSRRTLVFFSQDFSIDDQEKFDLLAFKNSKYLFYRFNDFIKAYGNPRYKLLHTRKMLDTLGMKKVEEKKKQFLIEKIIYGVQFEDLYQSDSERKPEIMSAIEGNYRIARRVYQQLHIDISGLFADLIRSMSSYELEDMSKDIRANGWAIKKVTEVEDA